jgi:hypothetical protein
VRAEADFAQHRFRKLRGPLAVVEPDGRTPHYDGAVEQVARRRHRQQRAHLPAAARLAEDRHVAGIAAEALDVVAHPLQRRQHVERAGIAGLGESRAAKLGEVHVAEDVEPLIDSYHHDVVMGGEIGAVDRHAARAARLLGINLGASRGLQLGHLAGQVLFAGDWWAGATA